MLAFLLLFVALGRLYRDMIKQPETRALLVLAVVVVAIGVMFYTAVLIHREEAKGDEQDEP